MAKYKNIFKFALLPIVATISIFAHEKRAHGQATCNAATAGITCYNMTFADSCGEAGACSGTLATGSCAPASPSPSPPPPSPSPSPIPSPSAALAVSVQTEGSHACVIVTGTGGMECWGYGGQGEMGNGVYAESDVPVPVNAPMTSGVTAIGNQVYSQCAVQSSNAYCWGQNGFGELGNGTALPANVAVPTLVSGTSGATAIARGETDAQVCAVISGSVKCWGINLYGETAAGCFGSFPLPIFTPQTKVGGGATQVAAGDWFDCAVVSGAAQCWGDNSFGQLGRTTVATCSDATPYDSSPGVVTGLGAGVTKVVAGNVHACALVSGAVKCWGSNRFGQLGNGTTTDSTLPVTAVAGGATDLSAGMFSTCAVVSGAVKCWGDNGSGELGATPVGQVEVFPGVTMTQGNCSGPGGTCVGTCSGTPSNSSAPGGCSGTIDTTGCTAITCSGTDSFTGFPCSSCSSTCDATCTDTCTITDTNTFSSVPLAVVGIAGAPTGVTGDQWANCALVGPGQVWCWGSQYYGELGNGSAGNSCMAPAEVLGL